jgi:hypothetical protein
MPAAPHDIAHLSALIEAARTEAKRLGPEAANVASLLADALTQARNIEGHGGHPDEGLSPSQLTTENDR